MAVCYFNGNYTTRYNCDYEIIENEFTVNVKYTIEDEIEPINGVQYFGSNTAFADRDILVVDRENKEKYLLKSAYYSGHSVSYGHPDGDEVTCFKSRTFLSSESLSLLKDLKDNPKTKKIRIECEMIIDTRGSSSIERISYEDKEVLHLSREKAENEISIDHNNIKSLSVGDYWTYTYNRKQLNIDIIGYIDINLKRKIGFEEVSQYVNELLIFLQLYKPGKFAIDKLKILVDDQFCGLTIPVFEVKKVKRYVNPSVKCDIITILSECYARIPYRNSKAYIRNIPYIILRNERGIEDTFLSYYRFIERYYKSSGIKGAANSFIEFGIRDHGNKKTVSKFNQEKLIREIISLRNQYVHSGYYLRNSCLKVKYPRVNNKKNPKDYTANNIDIQWIFDRTVVLQEIVIDIIFKEMLGFDHYEYKIT